MAFQYKGGSERSTGVRIGSCNIGGKDVIAYADSFETRGETMHVVRVEGIGKPAIFGAQKFCAMIQMQDAIAAHFRSLGQIE